jgi:hypothetical protein
MNDFFGIAFFADNPGEYYSIFLLFPAPQRRSKSFFFAPLRKFFSQRPSASARGISPRFSVPARAILFPLLDMHILCIL